MRSLAGSLADGVLADAILVSPHPPISKGSSMVTATKDACQHLKLHPYITAS